MSGKDTGRDTRCPLLISKKEHMKKLIIEALIFMLLLGMFTFTAFTAGYTAEKYGAPLRSDRCINSACEKPCSEIKRFKRHEGCVE